MDRRWLRWCVWAAVLCLGALRFGYLKADFPNVSPWGIDQAKFTDEGWWASAAVTHRLTGRWTDAGDYNPGVALPVWPLLLDAVFRFTGVSVVAARALSVAFSLASVVAAVLLVRRYSQQAAMPAALLLAASPFAFVFSRLAVLDTLVVFEFCLLLWVASYLRRGRWWIAVALVGLTVAFVLTKTTAVVLLPAVGWMAWRSMRASASGWECLRTLLAVGMSAALLLRVYVGLVIRFGFGEDYRFFFDVNRVQPMVWRGAAGVVGEFLRNCMWIDRVVYPLGVLTLIVAAVWMRRMWRNELFAASWIAIGCQAVFILSRQEDYAPRYFLAMLAPLAIVVVLAVDELRVSCRWAYRVGLAAIAVAVAMDAAMVVSFVRGRTFEFYDAATAMARTIRADPGGNHAMVGISGSQIALMTGLPAISDAYGTEELGAKLRRYRPGWYVAWSGIDPGNAAALEPFRVERVAAYAAFDDDDRRELVLYRMTWKRE